MVNAEDFDPNFPEVNPEDATAEQITAADQFIDDIARGEADLLEAAGPSVIGEAAIRGIEAGFKGDYSNGPYLLANRRPSHLSDRWQDPSHYNFMRRVFRSSGPHIY